VIGNSGPHTGPRAPNACGAVGRAWEAARRVRLMGELVLVERRDDGVAIVTLNNPKVNALSQALLVELRAAAEEMIADPPGAVVITGGERIFAAAPTSASSAMPSTLGPSPQDFIRH
jgi:hypothetical protein